MNPNFRNLGLWVIIVLLLLALFTLFQNPGQHTSANEISFSQLLSEVDNGRVRDVVHLAQRVAHLLHERREKAVSSLQHALAAGEAFILFAGVMRMIGQGKELFLELVDAPSHGLVQTLHAQGVTGLDQLLRAHGPSPAVQAGG